MQLRFILLATLSLLSCFVVSANSKTFNITFDEADFSYKSEERSGYQVGKTWNHYYYSDVENSDGTTTKNLALQRIYKIKADTLYNGKWYVIVSESCIDYRETLNNENGKIKSDTSNVENIYYVENDKYYLAGVYALNTMYIYTECEMVPKLAMDFSANEGDILDVIDMEDSVTVFDQYEVTDVAILPVNGIDRKVMTLRCGSEKFYWIEGIGVHLTNLKFRYGGFLLYRDRSIPGSTWSGSINIECVLGDELLYSWENFERRMQEYEQGIMAIEQISAEREKDTTLYDLMGRRIDGNPAPGIYIRGGKKIVIQ